MKPVKNVAASVRQRLLNRAKSDKRPFNELLQYYAMERFLYRLSQSDHSGKFILKGALMLRAWHSSEFRPTMDIDLLGRTSNDESMITTQIKDILAVNVEADGLLFDSGSVQAERITEDAEYKGIRIRFDGTLDNARIRMQVDIGFGDVIYPGPEESELPTMLDFSPPRLLGYSRESVIAEKFEAMVKLGELNSRMKDFYDIWLLSRQFDFDGAKLSEAIRRTFAKRETSMPKSMKAWGDDFAMVKQVQWEAFRKRIRQENLPSSFQAVCSSIVTFLNPVTSSLSASQPFTSAWKAPGPWR